ncbi:MAG: hypothetical protein AAF227_00435 [Pseudomonadota bacterium]
MRIFALCLIIMPSLAEALSCLPWGVTDAYLAADTADGAYVIVQGQLDFNEDLLPQADWDNQTDTPALTLIPGRISGRAWGRSTDVDFETDVTLRVRCYGPWCAGAASGEVLAFLRKEEGRYSISTNPCGGNLFGAPTHAQIAATRACLKGGACKPTSQRP